MTDILSRMAQVLSEKGLNDDEIVYIDRKLRQEYAGSYVYITRKEHGIDNRIMERIKKVTISYRLRKNLECPLALFIDYQEK